MALTPVEILEAILANPTDLDNVSAHTTADVTYVSLNYSNPMLKRVMPWCGTAHGPSAIVQTFVDVARYWTVEAFEPQTVLGDENNAAMFGSFTYRSNTLGKQVTSPFSVLARITDGKCSYLQFMEDTLATTDSFHKGGEWQIHSDPEGEEISI